MGIFRKNKKPFKRQTTANAKNRQPKQRKYVQIGRTPEENILIPKIRFFTKLNRLRMGPETLKEEFRRIAQNAREEKVIEMLKPNEYLHNKAPTALNPNPAKMDYKKAAYFAELRDIVERLNRLDRSGLRKFLNENWFSHEIKPSDDLNKALERHFCIKL
ncbi:MAG: hypothetical protein V1676_01510 [Candidatus Diapherotrites archaeon]